MGSAAAGESSLGGTAGTLSANGAARALLADVRHAQALLISFPKQTWLASLKSSFLEKQVKLFQVEFLEKVKLLKHGISNIGNLHDSFLCTAKLKMVVKR